jgi:hypothetical protein
LQEELDYEISKSGQLMPNSLCSNPGNMADGHMVTGTSTASYHAVDAWHFVLHVRRVPPFSLAGTMQGHKKWQLL